MRSTPAAEPCGGHSVQFYDTDHDLTAGVVAYLAEAVRVGGTALVIATPDHHASFVEALCARGVDVAAARAAGALVERDAAATLHLFTDVDGVDEVAFDQVVGDLVRGVTARGGPVRAFGEMVALLWEADRTGAALELERLWNLLGERLPFDLYCAYRQPPMGEPRAPHADQVQQLRRVADLHTAIVGPPPAETGDTEDVVCFYDPDLHTPAAARALVRETLRRWRLHSCIDDAAVVVSELATNAVLHARTGLTVALSRTAGGLRIAVSDSNPGAPAARPLTPFAAGGRGLPLITHLSSQWGVEYAGPGKTVWAELRAC